MIRPGTTGPRSLIRTTTDFPFLRFVTFTWLPMGKVSDAAVMSYMWYGSPLAVSLPSKFAPYHDAVPTWYGLVLPTGLRTSGCTWIELIGAGFASELFGP